jgi:hypothetical protein
MYRSLFERPEMLAGIRNDVLTRHVYDRIVAIARGENPEKGSVVSEEPPVEPVALSEAPVESEVQAVNELKETAASDSVPQ